MRELGEIVGPRGWVSVEERLPEYKDNVKHYGEFSFVWVVYNWEAKSALYKDGHFRLNGVIAHPKYWMDYFESTETRPKIPTNYSED